MGEFLNVSFANEQVTKYMTNGADQAPQTPRGPKAP